MNNADGSIVSYGRVDESDETALMNARSRKLFSVIVGFFATRCMLSDVLEIYERCISHKSSR